MNLPNDDDFSAAMLSQTLNSLEYHTVSPTSTQSRTCVCQTCFGVSHEVLRTGVTGPALMCGWCFVPARRPPCRAAAHTPH